MKAIFGTIGFFVASILTFKFIYGGWPPSAGNFGQWISSEPRAIWAMIAAIVVGIVGTFIGRTCANIVNRQKGGIGEASECAKRGLRYHHQQKLLEAIDMFKQSIEIYNDFDRIDDAAPVYILLGKSYFDKGNLDLADGALNKALKIYRRSPNAREAIDTINTLLHLISERKQNSDSPSLYKNMEYGFSFTVPAGWLKQKLVVQFSSTGGQIAISHKSHKATFNVSVGTPNKLEWVLKESRASAARVFLAQSPGRIGAVAVSTSAQVGEQSNTIYAEYMTQQDIKGVSIKRKNGFISIIHNELEYVIQWFSNQEYEDEVRSIIASFRFNN